MKRRLVHLILATLVLSAALHSHNDGDSDVVVETLAKSTQSWDGATLPHYPSGQPEVTILRIKVPVGVKLPMHTHPVINAGVVIAGELTVTTDQGEVLVLNAGEAIIEVVDKWHYGKNTGDEPVDIIVFYAGAVDLPITVLKDEDSVEANGN